MHFLQKLCQLRNFRPFFDLFTYFQLFIFYVFYIIYCILIVKLKDNPITVCRNNYLMVIKNCGKQRTMT